MRSRSVVLAFTAVAALATTVGDAAEERLRIEVTPRFSAAPATVKVRAMLTPEASNRSLDIVADSGNFYRSSRITLDGANTAAVTELMLKNLPAGEYSITVILTGEEGRATQQKSSEVVVTGGF